MKHREQENEHMRKKTNFFAFKTQETSLCTTTF